MHIRFRSNKTDFLKASNVFRNFLLPHRNIPTLKNKKKPLVRSHDVGTKSVFLRYIQNPIQINLQLYHLNCFVCSVVVSFRLIFSFISSIAPYIR